MLSEFTFPGSQTGRASRWRTRSLQFARTAVLSRKSPELPQWATWILAAAWVSGVGILASLLVVLALGVTTQGVWGASLLVWLTAHQATLITPDGVVSLLPMGLALIPLPLWRRASRWLEVQNSDRQGARRPTALLGLFVYVALCTVGALSLRWDDVRVSVPAAIIGATVVAMLGIVWGIRKQSPKRLVLPNALAGGIVAIAWFLVVGSVVLAVSALSSLSEMSVARQALSEDFVDHLGVLLLEVAYLPNLVIWAAAYATGAGISMGADQHISMFSSEEVLLPDLPILAAIPAEAPGGAALLLMVIAVGGWVSASVAQRRVPVVVLRRRLARAVVLAGIVLVFWFVALIISGGSLGNGRLDYVGPSLTTPFAAAALVGVGATIWALTPTLVSDARPLAKALRSRFGQSSRMPANSGGSAGDHDETAKSRQGSVSR